MIESQKFNFYLSDGFNVIKIMESKASINIAQEFRDEIFKLLDKGYNKIIVYFSATQMMDSTFLGALVVSFKKCIESGGQIHLFAVPDSIKLFFGLTKLDKIFNIFENIEDAKKAFK